VQQPNPYQPTYGELAFGSPGAPLVAGHRIAPASNWLQRNLYGGGYHEVGNYGAIDAFPHPGYAPAAGAQEDDALAQKMAELMQNQFSLKPKMQGPAYTPPFPEWYFNVLLPPRVKPPTEFTKFSGQDDTSTVEHIARYLIEGPIRRTREGGSEWEPIKILLEGDENSNKTNAASNTRPRLTTQVGQARVATGVPLDLGTNTHSLPTRECSGTTNPESTDPHRSDR
jgi:hypothetical protein